MTAPGHCSKRTQTIERWPNQKNSTASWPIEAAADGASYRYFRIFQTGKNSDGNDYLFCAGIELYGLLR